MALSMTEVLEIAAVVAVVVGLPTYALNSKTKESFDYRFFSVLNCIVTSLAVGIVLFDYYLEHGTGNHHGGTYTGGHAGYVVGILIYLPIAFRNFWKTNLVIGASGTLAQISVIPAAFLIGGPWFAAMAPLVLLFYFMTRPIRVHVVHHYDD